MTRLKALELFGFKSFADRTRFEFPEGITVVVGPNGSGKSNVVDAIKWVLGEQSVRSLRGKEMTDVIFAGSQSRKPLNYAEVSLIFDNAAGDLPASTPDVQITRRVQRSGESEYLINGETSRLRDIRELFSGTGAATEAYSVIEQGRVDALLVASGRDRRAVFEEAAGITKFRTRRAEALRRLERAELNRQRLADIVGEVASRLETVKHQAARARRWRQMTDRLRALRLDAAGRDLADVDAAVVAVDAALTAVRLELARVEADGLAAAEETAVVTATLESLTPQLAAARAAVAGDAQRAAAAEAMLALLRARRGDLEREMGQAKARVAAAWQDERLAAAVRAEAERAIDTLAAELNDRAARLAGCERSAAGSHDDADTSRDRLAATTRGLDECRQDRLRQEAACGFVETHAAEARAAAEAARTAVDTARLQHARVSENLAACEGNLASLAARATSASRQVEELEAAQRDRAEAIHSAWHELAGWQAKLEASRERTTVLRELVDRQDGLSDAARRLLASDSPAVPGLAGTLADLVVASVTWAPMVDAALGALGHNVAQSLVIDALDEAVRWHAEWAATDAGRDVLAVGGRIGFLATDTLRPLAAFELSPQPGIVGRLDRLLTADLASSGTGGDERQARLLESLLGRVWIVERIEHALPLLASAPAGTLFVSQDGHCLSAEGSFEIGTPAAASGLVARRAELRATELRRDELARTVAEREAAITALQEAATALKADLRQALARRQEAIETQTSSRAQLDRVHRERDAAAAVIATAERDLRNADERAIAAASELESARTALADTEPRLAAALDAVRDAQAAVDTVERSRSELVDEIQRLRIDQATATEKLARSRDAVATRAAAHEARTADVAAAAAHLQDTERRLDDHDLDLLAATASHAEAMAALERTTAAVVAAEGEALALDERRRTASQSLDEARATTARLAEAAHARELEAGEARHRRARIVERIRDDYGIDLDAELPTPEPMAGEPSAHGDAPAEPGEIPADRDELDRTIEELRRKLASMTTVNLEALQEAEELTARLATLEAQLADVAGAKESIEQLITRIDDESRRLLGDTIETVRGHFRDLFERLFGGGQADIVLEEGVDLLETSVEIVARPPGKEPRNISLLSGGEKTMTCVALLLAIFHSRPSPFCVLDEVDAALDEANVDRYVGVLRDFLSTTQFIVVTHSKKTMAAATTLYGVTMEESGVSKRVSVRFESTAAATRPATKAA
jgi:chromosome segregation protein